MGFVWAMAALGHKQPLSSLTAQGLVSATSSRFYIWNLTAIKVIRNFGLRLHSNKLLLSVFGNFFAINDKHGSKFATFQAFMLILRQSKKTCVVAFNSQ